MNNLTWPWIVEGVIISWRDFKTKKRPPYPSEFLATFVIFGLLSVASASETASKPATVFGWGIVLATFLNFVDPTFAKSGSAGGGPAVGPVGPNETPLPGMPNPNAPTTSALATRAGPQSSGYFLGF